MSRSSRQFPLDQERLKELALAYVGRFATTRAKLESYLRRKLRERGWEGEGVPEVEALSARMVELGYVNDAVYARMRSSALQRRGLGARRVADDLRQSGVDEVDGAAALEEARGAGQSAARAFARRKRLGPYARTQAEEPLRQKQIASFLRAGHDMATARRWVLCAPGEFPEGEEAE